MVPTSDQSTIPTAAPEATEPNDEDEVEDDDDDDDDDFVDVPIGPPKKDDQELLQLLGLGSAGKLNITIDLSTQPKTSQFQIEMTDDNRVLVENLHDLYRQLNDVYLSKTQTWIKTFIKAQPTTTAMKRAIELKNSIQLCLKMIENYQLAPKRPVPAAKPGTLLLIVVKGRS